MATDSRSLPKLPNKAGATNWVEKAGGLPSLIERAAKHLRSEKGYQTSRAIATAVNWAKKMCSTGTAFGGQAKVSAKAQAAACKAVAEWNAKRGKAKLSEAMSLQLVEAVMLDDMADFPLDAVVDELDPDGTLTETCPLDLELDDDMTLVEATTPTSHSARRSGESLGAYGSRLKGEDRALERAKKRGRDGKVNDPEFEKKHPRGRGGSWVLKAGTKGDAVKRIQKRLGAKADGAFGKMTAEAVRRFQKKRGLQVDGVVGAQTLAELRHRGAGQRVKPGKITRKQWDSNKLAESALDLVIPEDAL